jgi:hypothetical protein
MTGSAGERMTKYLLALLVAMMATCAFSAAEAASVAVTGSAPMVCSLGGWQKDSGPGTFNGAGSHSAINTYGNSDMVDGAAMSVLGAGQTLVFHAPLLCNTSITWSVTTDKGAFRNDTAGTAPAGFANQWLYSLLSGPYKAGGTSAASLETMDSDGSPLTGETHTVDPPRALTISYFGITFTPSAQTARMLAGSYSEKITLTVAPSL